MCMVRTAHYEQVWGEEHAVAYSDVILNKICLVPIA